MVQRQQGSTLRDITASGDFLGSWGSPIIGGGFYLAGLAAGDEWTRVTGRLTLEAIAYAGITTSLIKSVSGRSRPYLEQGVFDYHPWQFNTDRTALPSGHATMVWSLASVLDARIDHPAASVLVYSAALVTMGHRWHHDRHWLSDTVLGAAIGWGIGRAVVAMEEQHATHDAAVQTSIIPVLAPGTAGVHLVMQF
jgi:membrane-associated phospholipid phosphatase